MVLATPEEEHSGGPLIESVSCNLCGSWSHRPIYRKPDELFFPSDWFTVVECLGCGLGFVNPRPTSESIAKYYPSAFYDGFERDLTFHQRRYITEAAFLHELTAMRGSKRLLDIGCASGAFPRHMRKLGWDVEGVEVARSVKPIDDFPVYTQDFTAIPVSGPHYDAVTAWAVMEHVHDPKGYFAKVGEVLKKGGVFVFLVTNFNSVSSRHLFQEDVPRHLYFFTESCVRRYLDTAGMSLVSSEYSDRIYSMPLTNWLHYYIWKASGRRLEWTDYTNLPALGRYLEKSDRRRTVWSALRYTLAHPVAVADRLLLPAFARYQMWRKRYGIVTYVARHR